uniref:ATP synthase CF0 subunit I n=1 Tax=Meringosphaera mediterranea TaxID=2837474 RepID=UPI00286CE138|nr:ATP synthase CF0 subunit I [Meringosphaera mediterranea]WLD05761.1 ATP synthase CF0 subunit I [Meringosphaera mediterranea]WLD05829.1 ATP synthase CF0 subunit I [Meringosphaera mediterranea]WLD06049.1 ATP synthase CF0 subunit I [Meringosphaera mediterranea]
MEILSQTYMLLANEGFSINTNILETNLINQLVLGAGLFILGRDFLSQSLGERQTKILNSVQDSESRLSEATNRLDEAKKQLAQANLIIDQIKQDTESTKITVLANDFEQAKSELLRRFKVASATLVNRERLILSEIKQQVSKSALDQVVATLEKDNGTEANQTNYMIDAIESLSLAQV